MKSFSLSRETVCLLEVIAVWQGRQKLAKFNKREFATLIIDILNDAKRRYGTAATSPTNNIAGQPRGNITALFSAFFSHFLQAGCPSCRPSNSVTALKGDGGGGHWLVRMERHPAGWSVCLPLLIFPCTIKSRSSFLAPVDPGGRGKRAVKQLWCGGVVFSDF